MLPRDGASLTMLRLMMNQIFLKFETIKSIGTRFIIETSIKRVPMKHRFTTFLSSIPGPRRETIHKLQLLARAYNPGNAETLKDGWFDEHVLTGKAI